MQRKRRVRRVALDPATLQWVYAELEAGSVSHRAQLRKHLAAGLRVVRSSGTAGLYSHLDAAVRLADEMDAWADMTDFLISRAAEVSK